MEKKVEKSIVIKKVRTKEEILESLKLAEMEEGRTGLTAKFLADEKKK
jgi:hypothetical protein